MYHGGRNTCAKCQGPLQQWNSLRGWETVCSKCIKKHTFTCTWCDKRFWKEEELNAGDYCDGCVHKVARMRLRL